MNATRKSSRGRAVGILPRTALLSWLVTMVTLGIFVALIIPAQRAAFLENLASKSHGVAASLQDIAAGAAISEDYSTIVDHCTRILAEDNTIEYLVLTRKDGFSLIHDRTGWRSDDLKGLWLPAERVPGGFMREVEADGQEVYHYSRPFDYSGIQWGWIHVGLSLQGYTANVQALYHRTALAVVLCLFLGLLVSGVYARQLTRPIMQLRQAVQRLAEGDLSVRASVSSKDEVGELGASFNRMTESLLQRDMILQGVRFAAQQFLSADDWKLVIAEVLASVGRSVDATRVYVFENHEIEGHGLAASQRFEWVATGATSELDDPRLQAVLYEDVGLARWQSVLSGGRPVVGTIDEFPPGEKEILEVHGVKSIAIVPVHVGGRWWGAIGVDECRRERTWSEAEVESLRAAGHTLGAAIERDEARKALVLAKEAAEAASEAKSQFLANMSHEIRTPITGVMGMLHLLQRTELSQKQNRYVSNATTAASTLLTVIGDVLDFSKIEAGRLELDESDFSLPDVLDTAVRVFAAKAEAKGIELTCRLDSGPPRRMHGDQERLRQILVNLVGNALKFTEHGEIAVACQAEREDAAGILVRFSVRDTGCGIAREQQAMIFDAFSQADSSMSRLHGGTGLGLAICRQLSQLMGGAIGVESEPGKGATFWFTARIRPAAALGPATGAAPQGLEGLRVLVVDDCPTARGIVSEYVASWKGIAEVASDAALGLEALRVAVRKGTPFQVAILDWRMPGVDGVTMARLIKENPILKETGLVLLSSFGPAPDGIDAGTPLFAASVPKPVRMSELYDAVVTAANGHVSLHLRPSAASSPRETASAQAQRHGVVLLAEDNEINREVAGEMITALGYTCVYAVNGNETVEMVGAGRADLVLMDCQMPIMDGYEATRIIRQRELASAGGSRRHTPIIALTAHAMKGDREVCINSGMDDFLTKPLDPEKLSQVLDKWMVAREAGAAPVPPPACSLPADTTEPGNPAAPPAGRVPRDPIDYPSLLRRCMGKAELTERLVQRFLTLVRSYADDVARAVARGDAEALRNSAHRLKGSAATVSALDIAQVAAKLEASGIGNDLGAAPDLMKQLNEEVDRLLRARPDAERRAA